MKEEAVRDMDSYLNENEKEKNLLKRQFDELHIRLIKSSRFRCAIIEIWIPTSTKMKKREIY